ncbi:MAG: hypothetical protein IIZ44_09670 [Muribaculaceae bacterium]|nr:hypothetical protein [Muribaculaceae bacterium]
MQPRIDYCIYPTLLDSWWKFQNTKLEEFFYQDEQGGWHLNYNEADGTYRYSQEEMDAILEQELIDKINRVPTEPSEAASKGTIFNEIVDCIIENRKCNREGWTVESIADEQGNKTTIHGALDGFDFYFDAAFCKQVAQYFAGALPQYYVEAVMPVRYGNVKLYGWIDELCKDVVKDIKTTKRYEFGQYQHYWQRHVYPYCLIESGDSKAIKGFEFTVVKWAGGTKYNPVISGEMYKEYYTYDHCESSALIRQECERFIEWLEANKDKITNKKIFGGTDNE